MSNEWGKREVGTYCQLCQRKEKESERFYVCGGLQEHVTGVRNVKRRGGNNIRLCAKLSNNYIMKEK